MGLWDPQLIPVEAQAAKFSAVPPRPVSALWGGSEKSAEAASERREVKW